MRGDRRGEDGAAAVELGVLLMFLVLLLSGMVDVGGLMVKQVRASEAVHEGASVAARQPAAPATARTRALELARLPEAAVRVSCAESDRRVRVDLEYTYEPLLWGVFGVDDLAMAATAHSDVLTDADCVPLP